MLVTLQADNQMKQRTRGFAACLAESLWLSVDARNSLAAMPPRHSLAT